MEAGSGEKPPAGWYPDPDGGGGQRYFNGEQWEQRVPPQTAAGVVPAKTSGMAIASLVLGILWIYWIGSLLAIIFGYVAKKNIRESNGTQTGDGMATAGIVLGIIGVAVFVILLAAGVVFSGDETNSLNDFNS